MPGTSPRARGTRRVAKRMAPRQGEAGLTLIELIVAFSLLLILSVMALPVARVKVQREKERRLREALHEIRVAIDRHKDMADEGKLGELDPDNFGYPSSLEELVEGIALDESFEDQSSGSRGSGASQLSGSRMRQGRNQMGGLGSDSTRDGGPFGERDPFDDRNESRLGLDSRLDEEREAPESVRFLRSIPVDPITGQRTWGKLSVSDDPRSRSWSGRNVFDVYSLSNALALDGTRYSEW